MHAGFVVAFAGSKIPDGWELCDGRSVSKDDPKYKDLFEAIGAIHGGDANPMFQLPDYRGRFLRGVDGGAGRDPEAADRRPPGESNTGNPGPLVGSVQGDAVGAHGHDIGPLALGWSNIGNGSAHRIVTDDGPSWSNYDTRQQTLPGGGKETRPTNAYVNFIIKL
jgi:hypothetical protein